MKWWGYIHINGKPQVKRFFSIEDIAEARLSPFVERVYGPWEVEDRRGALQQLHTDHATELLHNINQEDDNENT